jgi:glycerophosphoryl diester phosphodiesterase
MTKWLVYILVSILCPFCARAAAPADIKKACIEFVTAGDIRKKVESLLAAGFMNSVEWFYSHQPQVIPTVEKLDQVKLVAHRGVHEFPIGHPDHAIENTLDAIRVAMNYKVWGVEIDVRLTADMVPVISHDTHLGRLFGRPDILISQVTFAELRRIEPRVPSLVEVLALTNRQIHLMIEIKENYNQRPEAKSRIEHLLRFLTPALDYHLITLNPQNLEPFKPMNSAALVDVIWDNPASIFSQNQILDHGAIAGHYLFLPERKCELLRTAGKYIGMGFPTSLNVALRAINNDADWIFTDDAAKLQTEINKLRSLRAGNP